jgi:hypothetical protein
MKTNNKPNILLMLSAVICMASMLVACAKNSSNGGTPDPVPVVGFVGTGTNGVYNRFFAQNDNLDRSGYFRNSGTTYVVNSLYSDKILKQEMATCSREQTNWGLANCSAWLNGYHDIGVDFQSGGNTNAAKIILRSYPNTQNCGGGNFNCFYYGSLPKLEDFFWSLLGFPAGNMQGIRNPLVLDATVWPIENGAGIELRANSPGANLSAGIRLFKLIIKKGKIEDNNLDFSLEYDYKEVANGRLGRCKTPSCGF